MSHRSRLSLPLFACISAGFGAGVLNGLLGAAGGILLVTVLPHLRPFPTLTNQGVTLPITDRRDALATVLCVMLPTSAVSFLMYLWRGVQPSAATLMTLIIPAALGGLLGAFLLDKIPRSALRKGFALVVVISGLRMLLG